MKASRERTAGAAAPTSAGPVDTPLTPGSMLALQRSAGNRAAASLVQRKAGGGAAASEQEAAPAVVGTVVLAKRGQVPGSSRLPGHEGKIEFSSFSWGSAANVGAGGTREGREAGQDIVVVKPPSEASPHLMQAVAEGDHVKEAVFEFLQRTAGGALRTTMSVRCKDGIVASYSTGGGGDEITFNFRTMSVQASGG